MPQEETEKAFREAYGMDAEAHLITVMAKMIRDEIAQEMLMMKKKWGIFLPLVLAIINAKLTALSLLRSFLCALIG